MTTHAPFFRRFWLVMAISSITATAVGAEDPDFRGFQAIQKEFYQQFHSGNLSQAEKTAERMQTLVAGPLSAHTLAIANAATAMGLIRQKQRRSAEAEELFQRALKMFEKALGPDNPEVAASLADLSGLYTEQGRFRDAEPLQKRAVAIEEKAFSPNHPSVAGALSGLAVTYQRQGRYAEAELLHRRALEIVEKSVGKTHLAMAALLNNLADLYSMLGRYDEAESLWKQARDVYEAALGSQHPAVCVPLQNLAVLYARMNREADAEKMQRRILAVQEHAGAGNHVLLLACLRQLAETCRRQARYDEAEQLLERARRIAEKAGDAAASGLADILTALATVRIGQRKVPEAEALLEQALGIQERTLGAKHPAIAKTLLLLATLHAGSNRAEDAKADLSRAVALCEEPETDPQIRFGILLLQADVAWKSKQLDVAVSKLLQMIASVQNELDDGSQDLAHQAILPLRLKAMFARLAEWERQRGDVSRAFTMIESSRIARMGETPLDGIAPEQAARLRQTLTEAQLSVANLAMQLRTGNRDLASATSRNDAPAENLRQSLRRARTKCREIAAEARRASPAYRLMLDADLKPVSLEHLAAWAQQQNAMVLEYLVGAESTLLFCLAPRRAPRVVTLTVSDQQSHALGIDPGPLTSLKLDKLIKREDTGILPCLLKARDSDAMNRLAPKLAALYEVLIPDAERSALEKRQCSNVVVIPDSSIADIPFEVLVRQTAPDITYVLDLGVPVQYAWSAGVMLNLANRAKVNPDANREPVLLFGNCVTADASEEKSGSIMDKLDHISTRLQLASLGVTTDALKTAEPTMSSVAKAFLDKNIHVASLVGGRATKDALRAQAGARRMIVLACRGFVHGFPLGVASGLLTSPGGTAGESDGGLCALEDIMGLDLHGCELVLLPTCSNSGGLSEGVEGMRFWPRAFTGAGARRVIASNWLVDDEATVSLVSQFCSGIAELQTEGKEIEYARVLLQSKLGIRRDPKWQYPFYWASCVLFGPNTDSSTPPPPNAFADPVNASNQAIAHEPAVATLPSADAAAHTTDSPPPSGRKPMGPSDASTDTAATKKKAESLGQRLEKLQEVVADLEAKLATERRRADSAENQLQESRESQRKEMEDLTSKLQKAEVNEQAVRRELGSSLEVLTHVKGVVIISNRTSVKGPYKLRWRKLNGEWTDWTPFELEANHHIHHSYISATGCEVTFYYKDDSDTEVVKNYNLEFVLVPEDRDVNEVTGCLYYFEHSNSSNYVDLFHQTVNP